MNRCLSKKTCRRVPRDHISTVTLGDCSSQLCLFALLLFSGPISNYSSLYLPIAFSHLVCFATLLLYTLPKCHQFISLSLIFHVASLLLFIQNIHLLLRVRQATTHVTHRHFSHPRLTSRSLLLTLLVLASHTLHMRSPPPHLYSPPPSSSKPIVS
jgi:hypothetical protein